MSDKTELMPCPFCKQQDALVEQLDSDASVVICQGSVGEHEACLCRGPVGVQQSDDEDQPGYDEAVRLWNTRAAPAEDVRAVGDEPRLTKKAKVGSVIFGEGVKETAVIQCAQRDYELSQQPEIEAERLDRLRATLSEIHGGDSRAVADEPVDEIDPDSRHLSVLALHDVMQSVPCSSLYSLAEAVLEAGYTKANPQRPVVLPERRELSATGRVYLSDLDCEWNACLDEFARLNP